MVHRAPDSRLLTNLIAHEKEYAKHLAGLFPLSHSALASLSAYAAASPFHPASPAQSIAAVVDVLASADDALQRYNQAVETWREQLGSLKDLEDDLTAVLRDRDILVTRLIKASKSTRDTHRSSRLITPLTGLGSVSLSSLPSTNSATTGSGSGPASTNSKLAQAQAELRACEAHLVAKERELDARRVSIAREGLGARCRALIDCGWVWGEMGKQGLKALQALNTSGVASSGHTVIPPHLGLNPSTYASDSSSLTPSQSASQTAARSVETSHEGPASKQHGHTTESEVELQTESKTPTGQTRATHAEEEGDLTITLPPAHSISELVFPTKFRSQPPQNGDSAAQKQATSNTNSAPTPAPRRKRTKPPRRPPSQHITEVSDEGSDGPSSVSHRNTSANVTANANHDPSPSITRTTYPTTHAAPGTHDTSSEDERPVGPLEVVENDPFEVIRKSMLGPSASAPFLPTGPSAPSARAIVPDVRGDETSPFKAAFPSSGSKPGLTPGPISAKRERRTSIAFLGSIRGLFRKPKDRVRVGTEWAEDHSSPSPSSPNRTKAKGDEKGGGWVTRTDARIKESRGGEEDSDSEVTPTQVGIVTTTPAANMARRGSGARLRKGRPGAPTRSIHDHGSSPSIPARRPSVSVGVDGWITDSPAGAGAGSGGDTTTGAGQGRSRTRRGTIKRKKTSVADLRGSDQGHTDGEVNDRAAGGRQSLEWVSSRVPEVSVSGPKPEVDVEEERQLARRGSSSIGVSTDTNATPDPNIDTNTSTGTQPRRAMTTTAPSSRKPLPDGMPTHRRSASLSLTHAHAMSISTSTQATHTIMSTERSISWRKPPPPVEPSSQPESPSQSQMPSQMPSRNQTEPQPKQNTKRQLSNGHAAHAYKHAQNQSLMSIVADVTRQNESEVQAHNLDRIWLGVGVGVGAGVGTDKARSLDIPRAPGSVLLDREPSSAEKGVGTGVNGRAHARTSSSPTAIEEGGRGRGGGGGGGQAGQGHGQGGQRPIKLPLRSALRNASRTPSPSPASATVPAPVLAVVRVVNDPEVKKEGVVQADAQVVQVEEDRDRETPSPPLRDSASISSYETTRESFYADEGERVLSSPPSPRSQSQPSPLRSRSHSPAPRSQSPTPRSHTPSPPPLTFTFPPPPVDPPPVSVPVSVRGEMTQSDTIEQTPSSNASTETPPVRRKSVRMSLQPTFSPTPPALYDEDGEGYAPWSRSFSMRHEGEREGWRGGEQGGRAREREARKMRKGGSGDGPEDMWADSSEEDEVYSRARRLLSLVGKHDKGKEGKGKARAQA